MMSTAADSPTRTDFTIRPRGPFSWSAAASWLDNWAPVARPHGRLVRLAFPLDRTFEPVAVALWDEDGVLHGEVTGTTDVDAVRAQVARIFSLDVDATTYPEVGRRDPAIGGLMERFAGLRPMLFTSTYECAAWAVMSQRISRRQAAAVQRRLVAEHGTELRIAGETIGCFPRPERLRQVLSVPGLAAEKVRRLHGVAEAALGGVLDVGRLRALGEERAAEQVRTIPGIGPFWGSAIYLRGVGATDTFPAEPRALAALGALKGLDHTPSGAELAELVEPYRPWRMWVCVLLRVASGRGALP